MAELNDQTKLLIVLALARFETPTEIMKQLREHGIEVTPQQVGSYDPTRTYYEASEKWKVIFEDERRKYLEEVSAVPIANQGFRLNALQRTFDKAMRTGNTVLANATLRQAAEEVGGALTNARSVTVHRPVDDMNAEERRAAMAEVIRRALEAKDPPGTSPAPAATQ